MELKINSDFGLEKIGFQGKGKLLKDFSETELEDLAILALKSNDKGLKQLFEELPELDELQVKRTTEKLAELDNEETD